MHLDDEQVQRLAHGEPVRNEPTARAHVADCDACRRRVEDAVQDDRELGALLATLDVAAPPIDADGIAAHARTTVSRPTAPRLVARPRDALVRVAAGLLVAAGITAVAYAVPGSRLRGWVEAVTGLVARRASVASAPAAPTETLESGIALAPGDHLVVQFLSPQGEARVVLTDATEVVVRGPAGAAHYTSDAERLVVDNSAPATFTLEVPRAAPWVEVVVGERRIFLKQGASVDGGHPVDGAGPYVVSLAPR